MATQSIWKRKRDLVYFVFFLTHLPIMLSVDLTDYYPTSIKPAWMSQIRAWYVATYNDRFFSAPPVWFPVFTFLELVFHLPVTLWMIPALLRNDPRVPLALLVFGLETSITTLVCMAEMLSWELTPLQRGLQGLGGMYGSYLAVGVFMAVDGYARVDQLIAKLKGLEPVSKKNL